MVNSSCPVHLYFKDVDQHGKASRQDKVHSGHYEPDFKSHICVGDQVESLCCQFGNGDDANNGGMFDQGYEKAGQWRQDKRKCLRYNHIAIFVKFRETGCIASLILAALDSLNASPDDFCGERSLKGGKAQNTGPEPINAKNWC